MATITPCLWFDGRAEEAARFYTELFPNSRITDISYYGETGPGAAGSVLTVAFELEGRPFVALNGGPEYTFSEAISFQVPCETQDEVDRYWDALGDGGEHGPCGWLKDKFGVSWQVFPSALPRMLNDPDREKSQRVMSAMMSMRKIELAELERVAAEV